MAITSRFLHERHSLVSGVPLIVTSSPDQAFHCSAIYGHPIGVIRPDRRQAVDVLEHPGHLHSRPTQFPDLSTQPSVFHCISSLVRLSLTSINVSLLTCVPAPVGDSSDPRGSLEKARSTTRSCMPSSSALSYLSHSGCGNGGTRTHGSSS